MPLLSAGKFYETVYDAARCYEEGYIQAKLDMLHMLRQQELRNLSPQETLKAFMSSDFSK